MLKWEIYLWLEEASKTPPLQQLCVRFHVAMVVESARIVQAGSNLGHSVTRPTSRIVQDAPARAEIRSIFWVFWCSQVEPLAQFLLCCHIVSHAFHVPKTSTICRKWAVIKSVLWLWSIGSLVAEIWPFQVGGCRVCACMCMYLSVYACI